MNGRRIIVAGNGPSAYAEPVRAWRKFADDPETRVFRTNYFFLRDGDPLDYAVSDWFICEEVSDCRAVRAACRFADMRPTIWVPGISRDAVLDIATNYLDGHVVRVQKCFPRLPAACKWERDLAPERPLMGSFALAVAVGMQPDEILLCGHDLFKHPSGNSHAGTALEARDWQQDFNAAYTLNIHRNHRFYGDVKYIRAALAAYRGKVSCVGSALAGIFRDEFPAWTWLEG